MKLLELLENQRLTIQLLWGEQKIEFFSNVIEKDDTTVYVTPYFHNGSELELNVTQGKGVICNLFTNNPSNKRRISWKNIELTTVVRDEKIMYCLKTGGFNGSAEYDDRRIHDRIVVQLKAKVFDGQSEDGTEILVHDISDIGISFYAQKNYSPGNNLLTIVFADTIGEKEFDISVDCTIARMTSRAGNRFVGCKIAKENKDYKLYVFMKRLNDKNKNRMPKQKDDLAETVRKDIQNDEEIEKTDLSE